MPKNLLQDMVKVKSSPTGMGPEAQLKPREALLELPGREADSISQAKKEGKHRSRYMLWLVAFFSLVFLFFALSYNFFSKATVTVNPKIQDLILNESLSASIGGKDVLPFDLIVISGEENKNVKSGGEKDVSLKAEGLAVLYNAFSPAPQMLSIDTRLEGSNGKIYKTRTKTIVPGTNKDGQPGSVEVEIYGAEAGEGYNSSPLDFTIFGFKGTPKYSKFYARSKGDLEGGFIGKSSVISDADKANAVNEIKTTLKETLLQKATDQIPGGFILFKDAIFLDTDGDNIALSSLEDNMLSIKLKGTLYGILFEEKKLTKKKAETNIDQYDESVIFIPNIRDLVFSLSNKDSSSFADIKNINFNLSGAVKIVWQFDADKLANSLLNKPKSSFNQILSEYPNIDSADLIVSPIWKRSIPNNLKDIKVIVNYPK